MSPFTDIFKPSEVSSSDERKIGKKVKTPWHLSFFSLSVGAPLNWLEDYQPTLQKQGKVHGWCHFSITPRFIVPVCLGTDAPPLPQKIREGGRLYTDESSYFIQKCQFTFGIKQG